MPWDVSWKKRAAADQTHSPEVRNSSYSTLYTLIVLFSLSKYGEYPCLPINHSGEWIPKSAFLKIVFGYGEWKKVPKKEQNHLASKGANVFLSTTANRKLPFFIHLRWTAKKGLFFCPLRRIRKKRAQRFFRLRRKVLRAQNRVLPAPRRLLRKTAVLTQMLRQRNSATANWCPACNTPPPWSWPDPRCNQHGVLSSNLWRSTSIFQILDMRKFTFL